MPLRRSAAVTRPPSSRAAAWAAWTARCTCAGPSDRCAPRESGSISAPTRSRCDCRRRDPLPRAEHRRLDGQRRGGRPPRIPGGSARRRPRGTAAGRAAEPPPRGSRRGSRRVRPPVRRRGAAPRGRRPGPGRSGSGPRASRVRSTTTASRPRGCQGGDRGCGRGPGLALLEVDDRRPAAQGVGEPIGQRAPRSPRPRAAPARSMARGWSSPSRCAATRSGTRRLRVRNGRSGSSTSTSPRSTSGPPETGRAAAADIGDAPASSSASPMVARRRVTSSLR